MAEHKPTSWPSGRLIALLTVGMLLTGGAAAWWWYHASVGRGEDIVDLEEPGRVGNPGYVGPQACKECHATRLAEFEKTRHYHACRRADTVVMPPGFEGPKRRLDSRHPGIHFEMSHQGADYQEYLVRETPAGKQAFTSHIDLIYGAGGQADEVFFTWKGDRLSELPVSWLYPQRCWGEQPFNPVSPGDLSRTTTTRCFECHNTWIEHVPGTANQYRKETAILGVTCENCHGPAQDHVEYHRAHPKDKKPQAVIRPTRLSRERLMDVCGQCHSNVMKARGPIFSYRPGEPVEKHFRRLQATGIENDHVADQVKYLRQSKCFTKSDTMTCITCHDPHRATDVNVVRAACLECHKAEHCKEQLRLPVEVRDQCVSCHMPTYYRVAVKFHIPGDSYVFPVRPHQHRIGVYSAATKEVLLNWLRTQTTEPEKAQASKLRAELGQHWISEGDSFLRSYRLIPAIGAFREADRLDPGVKSWKRLKEAIDLQNTLDQMHNQAQHLTSTNRFPEAIEVLEDLLKKRPSDALAQGKLGMLYGSLGQMAKAREHLEKVAQYDPDDAYGFNLLGWMAYLRGNSKEACEAFRKADEIYPHTAEINYRWGLSLLQMENWHQAEQKMRTVINIQPNHAGGYQGVSRALSAQGKDEEALRYARRAAKLTNYENVDVLITLVECYTQTGRSRLARETASQALERAQEANPDLVPVLEKQLRRLRNR